MSPTIDLGNLLTGIGMLVAFIVWAVRAGGDFRVLKEQVTSIADKMDQFITKEVVEEKERALVLEDDHLQRQIDDINRKRRS